MKFPTWLACAQKKERGEPLTRIEQFVYDNEPCDQGRREDREWREKFSEMLDEVAGNLRR